MPADASAAGARRDGKGGSKARLTILFVRHTNTKDGRLPRVCSATRTHERRFHEQSFGRSEARRKGHAHRRPANALTSARCGEPPVQGARVGGGFDCRHRGDSRRLSEPDKYYLRTKEAPVGEAACRDVLYVARAAEQHAGQQLSPADYIRALVDSVMGSDAVGFFVEAMTLTRRRQDLAPLVERTVERLHAEGLRAYAAEMAARGWHSRLDPDTSARRFWTIAIGVTLEGQAMGRSPDDLVAETLRLLGPQADAPPEAARLRVVGPPNFAPESPSVGKEK